ncbi:hypothetical protein [Pseudolabrys sp.]|jgi:hypothetical protein|uniref:hypothetical protein n=1 Tax=Pseudolabrys sp. TaxID=1960880 RepID=UPI003D131913
MSQSRFIGPITLALLAGVWLAVLFGDASSQQLGGLAVLTIIAGAMAMLTLRGRR